jgi:hypothetical protein
MSVDVQIMNRRRGVRMHLEAPASLRAVYGMETEVSIRDASQSGAFLNTREKPALNSRVAIRPRGITHDWMQARVARIDNDGIALEWEEVGSPRVLDLLALARRSRTDGGAEPRKVELEHSVQKEALARARSEVDSGEFDMQG